MASQPQNDYQDELAQGLRLFEAGAYWETHVALENAWRRQVGIDRHFLAGLIELAAAIYKTRQGAPRPGRCLYARALKHLAWVSDTFRGIDVRSLEQRCQSALTQPGWMPAIPFVDDQWMPR